MCSKVATLLFCRWLEHPCSTSVIAPCFRSSCYVCDDKHWTSGITAHFVMIVLLLSLTLMSPNVTKYHSNQHLNKGTWDKTQWHHAIKPCIHAESLQLYRLTSEWVVRVWIPGSKSEQYILIFLSPFSFLLSEKHVRGCFVNELFNFVLCCNPVPVGQNLTFHTDP